MNIKIILIKVSLFGLMVGLSIIGLYPVRMEKE